MSVITAIELNDFVMAGESARQPNTRHGRFRAAIDHAHFFDRRHPLADQFRHFHFERIWYAKSQATRGCFSHCIDNYLWGVSQNRRAPTTDVIDVFIPVHIPNLRALRTLNKKWVFAHMTKCTHWGDYPPRDTF